MRIAPIEPDAAQFPYARTVFIVERFWIDRTTDEEHRPKARYFISSTPYPEDPAQVEALAIKLAWKVRRYWGVENGQHWRRDVLWREDTCTRCCPPAAKAVALLRATALSLLRLRHPDTPTPDLLKEFAVNATAGIAALMSQK